MQTVDWSSNESHLFLSPFLGATEKTQLEKLFQKYQKNAQIWLASSGSSRQANESLKLVALSKNAILKGAAASNRHFQTTKKDSWLQVVPDFHIAGLAIQARAFLSQSLVYNGYLNNKWNAEHFYQILLEKKPTHISMVPTQVYDLVQKQLKAPAELRVVLVGGSSLPENLYSSARTLGWPLFPSFGMTECSSQVATASLESLNLKKWPPLQLLDHIRARVDNQGYLEIQSESLMDGYAQEKDSISFWVEQKPGEFYKTADLADVQGSNLILKGRDQDFIKIKSEGIHLAKLREVFSMIKEAHPEMIICPIEDERDGIRLILVHSKMVLPEIATLAFKKYNDQVRSLEKISEIFEISEIPKTPLGKINFAELKNNYLALSLTKRVK